MRSWRPWSRVHERRPRTLGPPPRTSGLPPPTPGPSPRTSGLPAQDTRAAPDTRPAPADAGAARQPEDLDLEEVWIELGTEPDAELVEIVDADPAVVDLAEAQRVVAGGAGLTR